MAKILKMTKIDKLKPLRCCVCQQNFTGKSPKGFPTNRFPYILECKHTACASCLIVAKNQLRSLTCSKCSVEIQITKLDAIVEELFLPDVHALGLSSLFMKPLNSTIDLKPKIIPAGCSTSRYNKSNSRDSPNKFQEIFFEEKKLSLDKDLKDAFRRAKRAYYNLDESDKKIKDAIPNSKYDSTNLETHIRDHFHLLHSTLTIREAELIDDIRNVCNKKTQDLENLGQQVHEKLSKLNKLIKDTNSLLNDSSSINRKDLIDGLNMASKDNTVLVSKENPASNVDVDLDPDIKNLLSDIGRISFNFESSFNLIRQEEIPKDTVLPEAKSVLERGLSLQKFNNGWNINQQNQLESNQVQVTHIVSPQMFFVQKKSHLNYYAIFSKSMQDWCKSQKSKDSVPNPVETGVVYLAKYETDNKWYRVIVNEIFPDGFNIPTEDSVCDMNGIHTPLSDNINKDGPTTSWADIIDESEKNNCDLLKPESCNSSQVKVTYCDFGNTALLPVSCLRKAKVKFETMPIHLIKCSLWDVEPKNSNVWSMESTIEFQRLVQDKELTMRVMGKVHDILQVDLLYPVSMEIASDNPVSVREAMVFVELATFPNSNSSVNVDTLLQLRRPIQRYNSPELLPYDTQLKVTVACVEDLSYFHIQMNKLLKSYDKMRWEMKEFYAKNQKLDLNVISPIIGHPYSALLDGNNGSYHRVLVTNLPGKGQVDVRDVDSGREFIMPYYKLRKIPDEFLVLPTQSYCCCLADVKPLIGETWNSEVVQFFVEIVDSEDLYMIIHKHVTNLGLVVSLFLDKDTSHQNINALLVQEQLAVSVGPLSAEVEDKKVMETVSQSVKKKKIKRELKKHANKDKKTIEPSKSVSANDNKLFEVRITHIKDPGSFYIQSINEDDNLYNLMNKMAISYEDFEERNSDWHVGDNCAVLNIDNFKWYRGIIREILDDGSYMVLFCDYGSINKQPSDSLRVLLDNFKKLDNFAVNCCLHGLKPAGDNFKWSRTACEAFEGVVKEKILHFKMVEDTSAQSVMAGVIFDKVKIPGSALEPDRIEFQNVNDYLLDLGVALPNKNYSSITRNVNVSSPIETIESQKLFEVPVVELFIPSPFTSWSPSEIVIKKSCLVVPTHVGYDGCIYLQTKNDTHEKCLSLSNDLQRAFKIFKYGPPSEVLREGQICSARYIVDNKYYRAKILKIFPNEVEVNFVDYGNVEKVLFTDIRIQVGFTEVPVLCLQTELNNVRPLSTNGQWTIEALNFMHLSIVDKICVAQIEENPIEGTLVQISLTLPSYHTLADLLVEFNFAAKIVSTNADEIIVGHKLYYNEKIPKTSLPNVNKIFPVLVSYILNVNTICLQKAKYPNPETEDEEKANKEFDVFSEMMKNLQIAVKNSPILEIAQPGETCCAQYSLDSNWYRCVISKVVGDDVSVMYLDYGNDEIISLSSGRLKFLPEEFFHYPKYGIICNLHGITLKSQDLEDTIIQKFTEKLAVDPDQQIFCQVKVQEYPPEVDLLVLKDGHYILAYEKFLKKGYITNHFML